MAGATEIELGGDGVASLLRSVRLLYLLGSSFVGECLPILASLSVCPALACRLSSTDTVCGLL